jgi:hypothetical protein
MATPDPRFVQQLRHDVDDAYVLLGRIDQAVTTISGVQRRHTARFEEIQQALDLQGARLDLHGERLERLEDGQRQTNERLDRLEGGMQEILAILHGRPADRAEGWPVRHRESRLHQRGPRGPRTSTVSARPSCRAC